jgi:hypothetical protein
MLVLADLVSIAYGLETNCRDAVNNDPGQDSNTDCADTDCADDLACVDLCGVGDGIGVPGASAGAFSGHAPPSTEVDDMHRVTIDITANPAALCFDDTPGAYYVRCGELDANGDCISDKWLIWMQGGSQANNLSFQDTPTTTVEDGDSVYKRWCGVEAFKADRHSTNYHSYQILDASNMGILEAGSAFAGWNVVALRYCSSDEWTGRNLDVEMLTSLSASHTTPFTGNFAGRYILVAALEELEDDPVTYTGWDGTDYEGSVTMPSLEDATHIVLAGASAAMGGVVMNLDGLAQNRFAAYPTEPEVRGLMDANFKPGERMDWSSSVVSHTMCNQTETSCSYGDLTNHGAGNFTNYADLTWAPSWFNSFVDETCYDAHNAQSGTVDDEYFKCADLTHVVEHHMQTPFLLRHSLNDQNVGCSSIAMGLQFDSDTFGAASGDMDTINKFAAEVEGQLLNLRDSAWSPEDTDALTDPPWVFGAGWGVHEGLPNHDAVFSDTELGLTFDEFLEEWVADWMSPGMYTEEIMHGGTLVPSTCPP